MRSSMKLAFICFLLVIPIIGYSVPDNSYVLGNNWYCNDGYEKRGNECIKLNVPKNAHVLGNNWYCNDGYDKQGNKCIELKVPNNAHVLGNNWYCNDGYEKQWNECKELNVPKNAHVLGNSWYCDDGYEKQGSSCVSLNIPNNAHVLGNSWYCNDGYKKQGSKCLEMTLSEIETLIKARETQKASMSDGTVAYQTKTASDSGNIIKLENGAIVEVFSYFGNLGYRKDAVLYGNGHHCNIWIASKKSFKCDLLKAPEGKGTPAKNIHISEVKGNGKILIMLDGSIYEVDSIDEIYTSLWLGVSNGLLINGTTLINFDSGEPITVYQIR